MLANNCYLITTYYVISWFWEANAFNHTNRCKQRTAESRSSMSACPLPSIHLLYSVSVLKRLLSILYSAIILHTDLRTQQKNKHIINNKMITYIRVRASLHLSSFLSLFCTGLKPSIYLYRAYAYTYLHTYTCVYINTCIYTPHTHSTSIIYNFINIAY